jgi:phosphopantothenoylcysteine decarboxylase/phosphopantothenate--cysteine ligase
MGLALAERAARRGAEVKLVVANVALAAPPGVTRIDVETASELADALGDEFDSADVLVMAAAPADFRPKQTAGEKIHREGTRGFELELEATDDILAILAARRREGQTIVGFAAETNAGLDRAREKLKRKGADAIVLNDVSRREIGFESSENEVVIVERGGKHHVPIDSKEAIADAILDRIEAIRSGSDARRAEAGE